MSKNKILLQQLKNKTITMEQFLKECAKWTVEIIDTFQFVHLPVKPKTVEGYESLPDGVKQNLAIEYFNDHPQIFEFYKKTRSIKEINQANYDWLKSCLILVDTEEEKSIITNKMKEVRKEELWRKV